MVLRKLVRFKYILQESVLKSMNSYHKHVVVVILRSVDCSIFTILV